MCSKQRLKNFLGEISENAVFPVFNYVSAEKYTILIKCRVGNDRKATFYNEYATDWIKKFSKFTKTAWIVRRCFPNLKRLLYRKLYVCHHSSFNKKKLPDTGVRNKECGAKIDFKMKFINRNTIKNDKSLREGLNLNIYIDFTHTHGVRARESFNLLKCSPETDETFYKYFSEGHTVTTAKSYHELVLLSKFSCDEYLSNSEINPTLHHVTYLHKKKKGEHIPDVVKTMADKNKVLEESGGVLRYTDDYSITVVITPFMKNVLTGHDLDYIIIDSTPIKEGVVSFFFVPTPLGALPIACALHSQNSEPSFSQAFFSTKLLIENQILKSFEPNKIMINVIDEQNHALDAIFSNKRLFISRASMVEEIWRIICDVESKIEAKNRHNLMGLFYSLLHAEDLDKAEKYYKELEGEKLVESVPKLKQYLSDIWNRREDYITQNQNKLIDISVRILKQFLLCKCNSYNSLIMIDVLMNILDSHWCQILHSHLKRRFVMETYSFFLPKDRTVQSTLNMQISGNEYRLDSKSKSGRRRHITFRSDTMCCDCVRGKRGRLCEHLSAILHTVELTIDLPKDKHALYTALAGEDIKSRIFKFEPEVDTEGTNYTKESLSNEQIDEYYYVVKQEIQENCDPLHNNENGDDYVNNCIDTNRDNMKTSYANILKALNDEFRRLNKVFKDNPNMSNLGTMGRLTRELSKIRPVEKVNLSNMYVELNAGDVECDE